MKILFLLAIGFSVSCATVELTEEEYVACKGSQGCLTAALDRKIVEAEYVRETKRIEKREEIVAHINACLDNPRTVIWERKRIGSRIGSPLRDRWGVIHIPRNANKIDYACIRNSDAQRILKDGGFF